MRKIYRKSARFGLGVYRRVGSDVFADVCDRDVNFALFLVKIYRVVKVFGIDGIDRAKWQIPQIRSLRVHRRIDLVAPCDRFSFALFAKFIVFVKDGERDFFVAERVVYVADNLDYFVV